MLVGTQRLELGAALFSAFPTLPAFDLMLVTRVNQRRDRITVAIGDGLLVVIDTAIGTAEEEGWTRSLIAGACAANSNNPDLLAFIAKYPDLDPTANPAGPVDHYEATFLVGRRVFLQREQLRKHLKALGRDTTIESRVLVVTGPRGMGKTYSRDVIGFLMQFDPGQQTNRQLAYVDLDQYATGLGDVAGRIGSSLGLLPATMPPAQGEQESRWVHVLADWLVNGINTGPAIMWWLVLDGFRIQTLPQSVFDLIDLLGERADIQTKRLRLVLLNYPRPEALPFSLTETVTPSEIERPHLESFMQRVYELSGKANGPVSTAVDEILAQVDQQLAKPGVEVHQKLKLLSLALTSAARKLLAS